MKVHYRFLIPLLLGLTGVWTVFLAPDPVRDYIERAERNQRPDVMERSRQLEEEVTERLRRVQVSDWITEFSQKAIENKAQGSALYMQQAHFEQPADLTTYADRLEGVFVDDLPRTVALGVVSVDRVDFDDPFPDYKPTMVMSDLAIAGEHDGQEFCLAIVTDEPHPNPGVGRGLSFHLQRWESIADTEEAFQHGVLRHCYWVAKYGLPGPKIRDWLERGGLSLGASTRPGGTNSLKATYQDQMDRLGTLAHIGFGTFDRVFENEEGRQCRYDRDLCGYNWTFNDSPNPNNSFLDGLSYMAEYSRFYTGMTSNPDIDEVTFTGLEEEFGPAAFKEFWVSELEPVEAFSSAFGIDPLDWSHERVVQILGEVKAGPTPTNAAILYGLLFGLLGVLTSTLFGIRRQTG